MDTLTIRIECQSEGELLAVLSKIETETDLRWNTGDLPLDYTPKSGTYPIYIIISFEAEWHGITYDLFKINYDKCIYEVRAEDYLHGEKTIKSMGDPIEAQDDPVNHPAHYASGKVECIDAMEELYGVEAVKSFCVCNMYKYLWRRKDKDNEEQDIQKALWYFDRYVELVNR